MPVEQSLAYLSAMRILNRVGSKYTVSVASGLTQSGAPYARMEFRGVPAEKLIAEVGPTVVLACMYGPIPMLPFQTKDGGSGFVLSDDPMGAIKVIADKTLVPGPTAGWINPRLYG